MKVKATVYVIKCPDTGNVVYVGVTADFKSRTTTHLTGTKTHSPIGRWIKHLRTLNKVPVFDVFKMSQYEKRWDAEGDAINFFLKSGVLLLNSHMNHSVHQAVRFYLPHEFVTNNSLVLR